MLELSRQSAREKRCGERKVQRSILGPLKYSTVHRSKQVCEAIILVWIKNHPKELEQIWKRSGSMACRVSTQKDPASIEVNN